MNGIQLIASTIERARKRGHPQSLRGRRLSSSRRVLRAAELCRDGERLTTGEIMRIFGVGRSTAKRDMRLLREYGFA